MDTHLKGGVAVDGHFIYAITETFIVRGSYSIIGGSMTTPKGGSGHYNSKGIGTRIEAGAFYKIGESWGFFGKLTYTSLRVKEASITTDANATATPPIKGETLDLFPASSLNSTVVTVGIMIPLGWMGGCFGGAESRGGTITVTPSK